MQFISLFCRLEIWAASLGSSAEDSQGQIQGVDHLGFYQEALWGKIYFKAPSSCWQNSILYGRSTEVPSPLYITGSLSLALILFNFPLCHISACCLQLKFSALKESHD